MKRILLEISDALRETSSYIEQNMYEFESPVDVEQLASAREDFLKVSSDILVLNEVTIDHIEIIKNSSNKIEATLRKKDKYESNTFKCKSDVEKCVLNSNSITEKTLCYALFARCVAKG